MDFAVIGSGWIDPGKHLHQRRFSGAVFAADRMDFALLNAQRDIIKRLYTGEFLGDGAHF
jgi:hypothetical protein